MHTRYIWILVSIVVCIVIVITLVATLKAPQTKVPLSKRVLFTCTTYFHHPNGNKKEAFRTGMLSLIKHHPGIHNLITDWYIVNESGGDVRDMQREFPWMHFVQKSNAQKGQAASLNMIRDKLRAGNYDIWFQWEESWFVTRPFLDDALRVFRENALTQLQLTILPNESNPNWFSLSVPVDTEWAHVPVREDMIHAMNRHKTAHSVRDTMHWPLFSLCPSLNDARFHLTLPLFNTDPALWPWRFEWEYARNWTRAGGKKGILLSAPVTRSAKHISTYA